MTPEAKKAAMGLSLPKLPTPLGNYVSFKRHGATPRVGDLYPETFDQLATLKTAVAGSPKTVRDFIAADIAATGANYCVPWLAFGDMSVGEAMHSVELFGREVMTAFQ